METKCFEIKIFSGIQRRKRRPSVNCNQEGEQWRGDLLFANGDIAISGNASQVVCSQVWVCDED